VHDLLLEIRFLLPDELEDLPVELIGVFPEIRPPVAVRTDGGHICRGICD